MSRMKIAIIPARGGSQRVPRKNIRVFHGRPIIAYSIDRALASGLFDRILVSTDDPEIAEVAQACGAEAPFVRPAELADAYATTPAVIAHAVEWALAQGWRLEAVCCIYATAPFLSERDLVAGYELLNSGDWRFAFCVTEYAAPISRAFVINAGGGVEMFEPERFTTRSQDLPSAYHDAAQFYWGRPDAWLAQEPLFGPNSAPVVVPRWRVVDIDTEEDWRQAEIMWTCLREQGYA